MPLERSAQRRRLPTAKNSEPLAREQLPTPEIHHPTHVYYAGRSQRRLMFLDDYFPTLDPKRPMVERIDGGPEDNTLSAIQIVKGKNDFTAKQIPAEMLRKKNGNVISIAADVRTTIPVFNPKSGVVTTENLGKPNHIEDVRAVFQKMSAAATKMEDNPYYLLDIGSESANYNTRQRLPQNITTYIELNPEKIAYFATKEGFAKYCREMQSVFANPAYLPNGETNLTNISGGIDLVTLLRLGAVTKIIIDDEKPGCKPGDEGFAALAKRAIYDAYISILPDTLRPYLADPEDAIEKWEPLQKLTDLALIEKAA